MSTTIARIWNLSWLPGDAGRKVIERLDLHLTEEEKKKNLSFMQTIRKALEKDWST